MPLFRMQKSLFLVAFISSLILSMTACSTALDKKDPPSEQIPDKQFSYTFTEVRIEFPSSLWELTEERENGITFFRPYKTGFASAFQISGTDVIPSAWGYTREQLIKQYFNYERLKLRHQEGISGIVEGTREIDGVQYPIMRYSYKNNGLRSDGLFMILFPDDLESRHRYYVIKYDDFHPEGKPAHGIPDLEFIVKNLEILPVLDSSDSNSVIDGGSAKDTEAAKVFYLHKKKTLDELSHFDFDNRLYIYQTMDEMVYRLYKTPYNAIVKNTTIEREGAFSFSTLVLRDRDADGQPDQFIYLPEGENDSMDFGFLFDLNKDGRADYLVFNGGPMATEEGKFLWMNYHWIDSNYDGRVDILVNNAVTLDGEETHPQKGLTAWMYDSDFDGYIDTAEYLSAGFVKPVPVKDGVLVVNWVLQDQKIVIGEGEWVKNLSSVVLKDINANLQ